MKNIICAAIIFLTATSLHSQQQKLVLQTDSIIPAGPFDNVTNQLIYSDSSVSTFLIWIKTAVPLHKHAWHTEQVIVLEGSGEMRLGEKSFPVQKGDVIFIPENTPHGVIVTSEIPLKVISIQAPEFKGDDRILISE